MVLHKYNCKNTVFSVLYKMYYINTYLDCVLCHILNNRIA